MTQNPAIPFDPTSPAFAANPYPTYAALRALEAPFADPITGALLLARMADMSRLVLDKAAVRAPSAVFTPKELTAAQKARGWDGMPAHEAFVQVSLLDSDGPDHRRLRKLVMGEFTATRVAQMRARITAHVDDLLDAALAAGEVDFVAELAAPLPGQIIGSLLGVPDADAPLLRHWSEEVVRFFDVGRGAADKARAEAATAEFADYLRAAIEARRTAPRDDLLSVLIAHEAAGRLDRRELISTAMLILMAGHGSTIDVMGSGLHALLTHPAQMAQLRAALELMPGAVEEMFRFDSPLPYFHRFAAAPVEVMGRTYPKGTQFGLLYGAANRDPAAFDDPDRFDVTRTPNRHIAFGRGAHLCLGNQLSRLDMEIFFTRLLARTKEIRMIGPVQWKPGLSVRGPSHLPVRLEAL